MAKDDSTINRKILAKYAPMVEEMLWIQLSFALTTGFDISTTEPHMAAI